MSARTPRRLELVELRFESLPDGRDAGVTKAFWGWTIGHIFREAKALAAQRSTKILESLADRVKTRKPSWSIQFSWKFGAF
jgi:hypothetical protein